MALALETTSPWHLLNWCICPPAPWCMSMKWSWTLGVQKFEANSVGSISMLWAFRWLRHFEAFRGTLALRIISMKRPWPTGSADGCSNLKQIEELEDYWVENVGKMLHQLWPPQKSAETSGKCWEMFVWLRSFRPFCTGTKEPSRLDLLAGQWHRLPLCWALESAGAFWKMGFSAAKSSRKNLGKMYRYKNQLWCIAVLLANCRQFETFRSLCIHRWIITSAWHESPWT